MNTNQNSSSTTETSSPASRTYERPGVFLSQDGQWVKIVHNGKQLASFHRNFFLKLLDVPYQPKKTGQ